MRRFRKTLLAVLFVLVAIGVTLMVFPMVSAWALATMPLLLWLACPLTVAAIAAMVLSDWNKAEVEVTPSDSHLPGSTRPRAAGDGGPATGREAA